MPIKVKYRAVAGLMRALNALDGHTVIEEVSNPQDPERVVRMPVNKPYVFSGETRKDIGRCLAEVNRAANEIADEEARLRREHEIDPDNVTEEAEVKANAAITKGMQAFLDSDCTLNCTPVPSNWLNLNENHIPISVLSLIDCFIKD